MAAYALWKTMKHYLQQADPAFEDVSLNRLEGIAMSREWFTPAIIGEWRDGEWWPVAKVYKTKTKPYDNPEQAPKYVEYRNSYFPGRALPTHLGEALTDLRQI